MDETSISSLSSDDEYDPDALVTATKVYIKTAKKPLETNRKVTMSSTKRNSVCTMSEQMYIEKIKIKSTALESSSGKMTTVVDLGVPTIRHALEGESLHVLCREDDFEVRNNLAKLITDIHSNFQVKIAQLVPELAKFTAGERGRVEVTRSMFHIFDEFCSAISCVKDNLTRERSRKFNFASLYYELGILNNYNNYTSREKSSKTESTAEHNDPNVTSPSGSLAPREWSNLGNNEASSKTEQKICEAIRETRKEHTDTHPSDASKRDNIGPTVCIVRDQRRATEINDAFKVIQSQGSGRIGGESSPDAPLYGEISLGSLDELVESLKEYCDLGTSSIFMDVGSGTGKPSIYLAHNPGLCCSIGIECDKTRWCLSMQNAYLIASKAFTRLNTCLINTWFFHIDLMELTSFHQCTHIYSFTCG